jgi:hypothetical protein
VISSPARWGAWPRCGPKRPLTVEIGLDLGIGVAGVIDPAGLVDHVEIEIVVDPQAIRVVLDFGLSIQNPFDVRDDLVRFEIPEGNDAVAMNR